jgi:hypothetical protein
VKITADGISFWVRVPTIREFCLEEGLNAVYHIWCLPDDQRKKIIPIQTEDSFSFVVTLLFQLGIYKEYSIITNQFKEALAFFIPNIEIDYKNKQLMVNSLIITSEI